MTREEAIADIRDNIKPVVGGISLDMAIKSLETIQRIDDVLNVEGMTEIDVLDEIMEAVSEFKYDCGVSE
jgi:hypothetical protein